MTLRRKIKIAAIIYGLILLFPMFFALPSVYNGGANITIEGEQIDGGLGVTVFVATVFIFMWIFTVGVTYALLKMKEDKKKSLSHKKRN